MTSKTRVDNWPIVLNQKVDEWRTRAFAWGSSDCCQFVADVSTALIGEDRRALFPEYASEAEALAILDQFGGMEGLLSQAFGEQKPVAWAKRGDVVLADFGHGPAAAICLGVDCCAPGPNGLVFQKMQTATAAWEV